MIETIPHRVHRHTSGRTASIYGACPWVSDAEAAEWETVTEGWTWVDHDRGTVGLGRTPVATREEAEAFATRVNADRAEARTRHAAEWAPVNAPVTWTLVKGNDGSRSWTSGEGYTIRKVGAWHVCEDAAGTAELPAYRKLRKAKDWCEGCIRSERQTRTFG